MKVIQIPFCFYPDPVGGTEVYVGALSHCLQKQGMDIVVVSAAKEKSSYLHAGLKVIRFAVSDRLKLSQLYGNEDPLALRESIGILDNEKPDILHLHALTSASSQQLIMAAKEKGIKTFFTYHTPTVSCQRGSLLYMGKEVCDGKLKLNRCTRCNLQGLGINQLGARVLAGVSQVMSKALGRMGPSGGPWTALRMSELIGYGHKAFCGLVSEVGHIISVCDWVKELLVRNGVSEEKITVLKHGLCHDMPEHINLREENSPVLRLVYFGRVHPNKGIDVIIEALKKIPEAPVRLDIYGILQHEISYYQRLLKAAGGDSRISFKEPVPTEKAIETLQSYDFLVVPSQWMETGPIVILEAFAAKVPVIASGLGGIAEKVTDGVNGILVKADDVNGWADAIKRCSNDTGLRKKLQAGIEKPVSMDYVATEMKRLYMSVA